MIFLEYMIHLTLNLRIYQKLILIILLRLVLLKIKKTFKFSQLLMMPMKILKLDMKLHMVAEIMNLQNQEVVYFVKLHLYWLENVMNFMGPSQKNIFCSVSVLQPKALNFHYFILKVPSLLQFFGRLQMTTIILRGQLHHLFCQVRVKKKVLLIFQLTFVQDSKILLLPQVQTIVTVCLDMTWCVQLVQIIVTCANTGNGWLNQTL